MRKQLETGIAILALIGLLVLIGVVDAYEPPPVQIEQELPPDTLPVLENLRDSLLWELEAQRVPFGHRWLYVAIAETGWQHDKGVARVYNYWGMRATAGDATAGNPEQSQAMPSLRVAVQVLKHWCDTIPPKPGETLPQFLQRRHYNDVKPGYYQTIARLLREDKLEICTSLN